MAPPTAGWKRPDWNAMSGDELRSHLQQMYALAEAYARSYQHVRATGDLAPMFECTYSFTAPDGVEIKFTAALIWYVNSEGRFAHLHEHTASHIVHDWLDLASSLLSPAGR